MPDDKPRLGRLVVIGSRGQLGQALMTKVPYAIGLARDELDLSRSNLGKHLLDTLQPFGEISGIINAAAYTAVDKAEIELDLAMRVNSLAPGSIAEYCETQNIPLVHISTDYVFSGDANQPYQPFHQTSPINFYGRSKLGGETEIGKTKATCAILRTSWVFDGINKNFLTTMLRLADTRPTLSVVSDQIGRPTYTVDLAKAALRAIEVLKRDSSKGGLYHISNCGQPISWAEFANAIFEISGVKTKVEPISTEDYPTPAERPAYSVLDLSDFERAFDFTMPSWRDALSRALQARSDIL